MLMDQNDNYFEALNEELIQLYDKYENCYGALSQNVIESIANKRYFSGSREILCIYEPSLIDRLQCNWCLKGSFKEKKPRSQIYHLISFDNNENMIKTDYYDRESYDFEPEHKEIFAVREDLKTIYLLFEDVKKSGTPMLLEIYLMKYNDMRQLTEYVHIPSKALRRDLTGEIHKYEGSHLIETIKYSTWYSDFKKYEFSYGSSGYLNEYKFWDINQKDPYVHSSKVSLKDVEVFEKYGRFYFSPAEKSSP